MSGENKEKMARGTCKWCKHISRKKWGTPFFSGAVTYAYSATRRDTAVTLNYVYRRRWKKKIKQGVGETVHPDWHCCCRWESRPHPIGHHTCCCALRGVHRCPNYLFLTNLTPDPQAHHPPPPPPPLLNVSNAATYYKLDDFSELPASRHLNLFFFFTELILLCRAVEVATACSGRGPILVLWT
jgi:hypothetical protein